MFLWCLTSNPFWTQSNMFNLIRACRLDHIFPGLSTVDLRRVTTNFENKIFHEANSKVSLLSPLLADQLVSFTYVQRVHFSFRSGEACCFQRVSYSLSEEKTRNRRTRYIPYLTWIPHGRDEHASNPQRSVDAERSVRAAETAASAGNGGRPARIHPFPFHRITAPPDGGERWATG